MTREIKFRAQIVMDIEPFAMKKGHWVEGYYYEDLQDGEWCSWIQECNDIIHYKVDKNTLGQFTGLLDKNGKEIFEGDIIEIKEIGGYGCKRKGIVEYDVEECAFIVRVLPPSWAGIARLSTKAQICADGNCTHEYINQYTVIGNIHDNPELLKTETL